MKYNEHCILHYFKERYIYRYVWPCVVNCFFIVSTLGKFFVKKMRNMKLLSHQVLHYVIEMRSVPKHCKSSKIINSFNSIQTIQQKFMTRYPKKDTFSVFFLWFKCNLIFYYLNYTPPHITDWPKHLLFAPAKTYLT